jgi:hypothetical protein
MPLWQPLVRQGRALVFTAKAFNLSADQRQLLGDAVRVKWVSQLGCFLNKKNHNLLLTDAE